MTEDESTALVVHQTATPMPAFTGADMSAAFTAYRELQQALDASMPDQIMTLDGKPFRKKGYWRAIAVAFNLTVDLVQEIRTVEGAFEDGQENFGYKVLYRASAMMGRSMVGDGACFAVEKGKRADRWKVLPTQATEHNVRSHAHTRAFNRAVSNLVGFGEVSYEEVERDEPLSRPMTMPAPTPLPEPTREYSTMQNTGAVPQNGKLYIVKIDKADINTAKGVILKAWIQFSDKRIASTIKKSDMTLAEGLFTHKEPCRIETTTWHNPKTDTDELNLVVLERMGDESSISF